MPIKKTISDIKEDFLAEIFYGNKIVICPNCNGMGKNYLYNKEEYGSPFAILQCITCDGKGRLRLTFEKLKNKEK